MSGLMGFDEAFRAADLAVRAVRAEGLRDIERVVLEGSWYRQTYQKIASTAGYTEGYLSRDVGPALWEVLSQALGVQVKKTNFRTAIERWSEQVQLHTADSAPEVITNGRGPIDLSPDEVADVWPFDVTDFRGRHESLSTLANWITQEHGRLLCLSGLPGVGKSWFAIKLAEQVRGHFQRFVYEDLRDRPRPQTLVNTLLTTLNAESDEAAPLPDQLDLLIQKLVNCPSLIVLDSTESLCCQQELAGVYAAEFADYQQILSALASREHASCIVWVGRELPHAISAIAGSSCRRFSLGGLLPDEITSLAVWSEKVAATPVEWGQLSQIYGGLPALILSTIAPRLPSFGHRLDNCITALQQEKQLVYPYVENWLAPLSQLEWQVLTWMMISRRPLSLAQLSAYLGTTTPLAALESLCDRGICRALVRAEPAWELALPELLMPYLGDRFCATFFKADEAEQLGWLNQYSLIQADAPEMVQQWQRQTLLSAVAQHLETLWPTTADKKRFLAAAFLNSQTTSLAVSPPNYLPGNLMNLAHHWQIALVDVDFHGLKLQGADLQSDLFQGVSFAGADLSHTLLAKPMGQCPVIAVNPQREEVAVGDQDGRLLLWDLQTGRLQRAMLTVTQAIRAIAFSPDGLTLAEGRQDGTVRFWDLPSDLGPERLADNPDGALTTLAFSPDKALLAGGDEAGNLHVWRLASGEKIHCIPAHAGAIAAIAFSPCGKRLLSCGHDCAAVEWDVVDGVSLKRFQGRLTNLLGTVAYVPSMTAELVQAVVVGRDEGQLVVWDLASARPKFIMNEPCEAVMAVALSADGRYLAASDVSNTVSVWEIKSRSRLCQITKSSAPIESLVFNPSNAELMTGCDYTVQRWEIPSGQCLRIWRSDRHPARQIALSTAPLQLLSSHDDQTLRCWEFSAARQRWLPQVRIAVPAPTSKRDSVRMIASSLPASYWAVGTESGSIHLWDRQAQVWLQWAMRLPKAVTALAFSPDGTLLAAGDATGTVALWDLSNRIFRWQKNQVHADQVMTLTFSPDGQQVYSGSRDRTIRAWNFKGEAFCTLVGHRRRVHTLQVSADGRYLYSGSYDGTVQTWQISTGQSIDCWQQPDTVYIHAITLDEHQHPLAIISDTQTLALWEIASRTCRATCTPDEETLWHVSLSPDGQSLVCARQNGEISLWSVTSGEIQGQLRIDRPYEGMQIGGCSGLTDSERQMLYSLGASDY